MNAGAALIHSRQSQFIIKISKTLIVSRDWGKGEELSEKEKNIPGSACAQTAPCCPSLTVALRPVGARGAENRRLPMGAWPYRMLEKL